MMKNKVLVELIVPELDEKYDMYIPINKRIGNIIVLLNKAVSDLTNGIYTGSNTTCIYNRNSGLKYNINDLVRNTDIRNGTTLVLM